MGSKKPKSDTPADVDAAPAQEEPRGGVAEASSARRAARADQRLVEQCLAGDERAWEQLYRQHHRRLLEAIKLLLGPEAADVHLVDEIAARVWYALLRDDGQLLARYDAERDSRLQAFLMGLARIEIMRHARSERRRKSREFTGGRRSLEQRRISHWQVSIMMNEFASTLTPREQDFMEKYLLSSPDTEEGEEPADLSLSNIWQQRHRIRSKLKAFFRNR
ncbi:MAG: hypothetical protein A2V70_10060 [Planctomycetes bacterium RBG_13_63_9]|nr:MAG: hypothetical protein A2V70_10060 [Planctomycetes bacterium RBG_13_63_9]